MAGGANIKYIVFDLDDTIYDSKAHYEIKYAMDSAAELRREFSRLRKTAAEANIDLRIVALTAKRGLDYITDNFLNNFSQVLSHPSVIANPVNADGSCICSHNSNLCTINYDRESRQWHVQSEANPSGKLPLLNIVFNDRKTNKGHSLLWMASVTGVDIANFTLIDDKDCMLRTARRAGANTISANEVFNKGPDTRKNKEEQRAAFLDVIAEIYDHLSLPLPSDCDWSDGEISDESAATAPIKDDIITAEPCSEEPKWKTDGDREISRITDDWQRSSSKLAEAVQSLKVEWEEAKTEGLGYTQEAIANPDSRLSRLLNSNKSGCFVFFCGPSAEYIRFSSAIPPKSSEHTPLLP